MYRVLLQYITYKLLCYEEVNIHFQKSIIPPRTELCAASRASGQQQKHFISKIITFQ